MTTLPEEAVKAAQNAIRTTNWEYGITDADMAKALSAALPFLPVHWAVKKLEWNEYNDEQGIPDRWDAEASSFGVFYSIEIQHDGYRVVFDHEAVGAVGVFDTLEAAKAAAQADYSARILSALEPSALDMGNPITLTYTNYRGETSERAITPIRPWFGSTEWHPDPQWLLRAYDHDKGAERDFALKDFGRQQPSAARSLALEEAAKLLEREADELDGLVDSVSHHLRSKAKTIRTLSSPDHADAGHTQARDVLARFRDYVIEGITAGTMMRGGEHHNPIWQDVASALHADAGKVDGDGWMPIESAPKDGKVFLAVHPHGQVDFFHWQSRGPHIGWRDSFITVYPDDAGPKIWMPIPPLPYAPSEGAE